jgi:hypothetical protein
MEMKMLSLSIRLCGRSARLLALATACAIAFATAASAAPLASASFGFVLGALPPTVFPGVGATGTATGQLSASLDAGSAFAGAFTTPSPTTAAPPISAFQIVVTKNAGATFTGTAPGNVGGNLSIKGAANLYGLGGFPGGGPPLLSIPLNIGTPNTISVGAGGVNVTAIAAGWTVGTAAVTGLTGTATTVTMMGSNALTPGGQGTLVLVTPVKVLTNIAGQIAAFGTLTLTYVPEPGTLALVALGMVALAAAAPRLR